MDTEMEREGKYKIHFCENLDSLDILEEKSIYIAQSINSWNDFAIKTHCEFTFKLSNKDYFEGEILVGIVGSETKQIEKTDSLEKLREQDTGMGNLSTSELPLSGKAYQFFTLLPSMEQYRLLIEEVDIDEANLILESLNDLVFLQENDSKSALFKKAISSKTFAQSFMRNSEPFFAFHNAGSVLEGLEYEQFNTISENLDLKFQLDGFECEHNIKLKYASDGIIPKRINILIGKNGLGKSQALNHFVRGALQQKGYNETLTSEGKRPLISRVLAIGTPGETKHTYPEIKAKNAKLNYKRLLLTRNSASKFGQGIGSSLLMLARYDNKIGKNTRWEIFTNALSKCFVLDEIYIPLSNTNNDLEESHAAVAMLPDGWGEQKRLRIWASITSNAEPKLKKGENFYNLSSGQLSFFKFALLVSLHIENGSFILLDEPETHLHPNLISDFIELLDSVLEKTGSFALIATHSAYFVREVPREQVHVFKESNNGLDAIISPRLKTFGAEVGAISHFVFNEAIENKLSEKIIESAKVRELSYEHIHRAYKDELSTELLMEIRRKLEGNER